MRIPAKFNGRCAQCGHVIKAGDEIDYIDKKAYHPQCASDESVVAIADRLGYISHADAIRADWCLLLVQERSRQRKGFYRENVTKRLHKWIVQYKCGCSEGPAIRRDILEYCGVHGGDVVRAYRVPGVRKRRNR